MIDSRLGRNFVLDVLDQIGRRPDFLVYVRGEGSYFLSKTLNDYFARQAPARLAQVTLAGFKE
jgi:hypothetical protein